MNLFENPSGSFTPRELADFDRLKAAYLQGEYSPQGPLTSYTQLEQDLRAQGVDLTPDNKSGGISKIYMAGVETAWRLCMYNPTLAWTSLWWFQSLNGFVKALQSWKSFDTTAHQNNRE